MQNRVILSGSSTEEFFRLPGHLVDVWKAHLEISRDGGASWTKLGPLADPYGANVIQPTILLHGSGGIQLLLRSLAGRIQDSWSSDGGQTWTPVLATELPNPDAGIDAVTLVDGRSLLVYNHTTTGRRVLNVAVSPDGRNWDAALELESSHGEFSYPAVIQSADGLVHVTYTWQRKRIRHAVLDPRAFRLQPIRKGQWPK